MKPDLLETARLSQMNRDVMNQLTTILMGHNPLMRAVLIVQFIPGGEGEPAIVVVNGVCAEGCSFLKRFKETQLAVAHAADAAVNGPVVVPS